MQDAASSTQTRGRSFVRGSISEQKCCKVRRAQHSIHHLTYCCTENRRWPPQPAIECGCRAISNHGCGGAVCSPANSAPSASRLAAEAPFVTKISIALPGVEPRFLKP